MTIEILEPTRTRRPRREPEEPPRRRPRRQAEPRRKEKEAGAERGRKSAAEKAYARRQQRSKLIQPELEPRTEREQARGWRWPRSRASFVLIVMALLAVGVAVNLWLSTQAIADSYRLDQLRQDTARLAERGQQLQRDVTQQESAQALADKAKHQLGMVPAGDLTHIVIAPDGTRTVIGEPKKAEAQPRSAEGR